MDEGGSSESVDNDAGRVGGHWGSGEERKVSTMFQERGTGSKVAKLKEAFEDLREVDPEESMPDGIAETAEDLVSAKVMNHLDRDYRLLVACCLVEVLRIYAPDAPYEEDQLLAIFALITTQLRGLSMASEPGKLDLRTELTQHLIQSLVHVKSCVILVFLTNDGVPGGLEQLIEMFEVLLTSVRETHSQELKTLVREALELCISELDELPQPLLDTVLIQLLPVTKNENPASYNLAKELLNSTFEKVHAPISVFVNSVLSGAAASSNESELKEHVLPLVYELHKVNPLMMLYVFPELAEQLKAEDIEVRSGAVSLLGRLFMSKFADYGVERPEIWQKFLGRFIDADVSIRSTMVTAGAMIARTKPRLRAELYEALGRRLHDPDAGIRKDAVRELVELAHADPDALSRDVLEAVGQRIKDRKPIIRQAACVGLGKAYNRHVSSKWVPFEEGVHQEREDVAAGKTSKGKGKGKGKEEVVSFSLPSAELSSKLGWVPSFVVKALGYRDDWGLRAKVLELLDAYIVPKHLSDEARAIGMAHLRHGMDPPARQGLTWILQDKRKVRGEVLRYLDAREAQKNSPKDKSLAEAVEARLAAIMAMHPTSGTKMNPLHDLNKKVDNKVFRLFRTVCASKASHATVAAARSELLKKVGSRTVLGDYVRTLAYRCSVLSVGVAGFQQLCLAYIKGLEDEDEESYLPPLGLLETLVSVFPEQTKGQHEYLAAMFQAAQASGLEGEATRVLSLIAAGRWSSDEQVAGKGEGVSAKGVGRKSTGDKEGVPEEFLEALVEVCTTEGNSPAQATIAVRALAALSNSDSADISEAARYAALDALRQAAAAVAPTAAGRRSRGPSNHVTAAATSVAALSAFAQEFPQDFQRYEEKVLAFVTARMSAGHGADGEEAETAQAKEKGGKCAGGNGGGRGGGKKRNGGGGKKVGSGKTNAISPRCDTLCSSIDLACSCLMPTGAGNGRAARAAAASLDMENLFKTVFTLLKEGGQPPGQSETSDEEKEKLRLVGSTCVVRLCMGGGSVVTSLIPERWHALAWTMMDPSEKVRAGFMREVCRGLEQTGGTSSGGRGGDSDCVGGFGNSGASKLRFMAYLCLAAFESEPLRSEVRLALSKKVRQLRLAHAAAASAAAASAAPNDSGVTRDEERVTVASPPAGSAAAALEAAMPEGVLPYVVHLLAHHPDFPMDKDDKLRMKNLQRYLEFLLGPLLSHGQEGDNLSMLLQMLDTIITSYLDRLEPSSNRIHVTAHLARQLLTNRIRTQSNLQHYPGKIFLPAPLFERRARSPPEAASPSPKTFSPTSSRDSFGAGDHRASGSSNASPPSRRVRPRTPITPSREGARSAAVAERQSLEDKRREKTRNASSTREHRRRLAPGSTSAETSSLGTKSAFRRRSEPPASPFHNTAADDEVASAGPSSPSLSPISAAPDSPFSGTRRRVAVKSRSGGASGVPQWGSPVSSTGGSSEVGSKKEASASTPRRRSTISSRRPPVIGKVGAAAGIKKCSVDASSGSAAAGVPDASKSRAVRAARRRSTASPGLLPRDLETISQQLQSGRKRSGRSPSADAGASKKAAGPTRKSRNSVDPSRPGPVGEEKDGGDDEMNRPSPAKKGKRDNERSTATGSLSSNLPSGSGVAVRRLKNVGRKVPLAARQEQQQQPKTVAATATSTTGVKKKPAEAAAAANAAASPARRKKLSREASPAKTVGRVRAPAEALSRQARADRRARANSVEEKQDSVKATGKEEEDSEDEALMELARRRRAAMQE